MFKNTFEHGWSDAVHGKQRILGSQAYTEGYDRGVRHMTKQRAIELTILGLITIPLAICFAVWFVGSV